MHVHLDFETFSYAPLKKCGGYRYSMHESTEILCACWAIDDEAVETWVPCITADEAKRFRMPMDWHYGPAVPAALAVAVKSGCTIIAHNAQFERAVWQNVVVKRHAGPSSKVRQFVCTAARSAAAGLPRSLDGVGMALDTNTKKNPEGAKLLKMFAMPRKPTKTDARTRIMPLDDVAAFTGLVKYCQDDVLTERDVDKIIPDLHPMEQKLFAFDMQINERGLFIDIPLVKKASEVVSKLEAEIVAEVKELTRSNEYPEGLRPTQRDKMMGFFQSIGVELENMQADHVRKYMKNNVHRLNELGRRLLLLRMEAGKASTKKLASMMEFCAEDHVARGTLLFYGAHTGRWSGKGVQPHNFIRGMLKYNEVIGILEMLKLEDHEVFQLLYEWPITAISQCMRSFIMARKGRILRVVDYSSIEARVLAWLAQEQLLLNAFIHGLDVYKVMASSLYAVKYEDVTSEQRRIGKNLVLGCGYGLGGAKFVQYSEKAGTEITEEFAKAAVRKYREANRNIIRFWGDVERCAIQAVREGRTENNCIVLRNLRFFCFERWFCIQLPSGRRLHYYKPKVVPIVKFGEPALALTFKVEIRGRLYPEHTYGGKLVENIVQAVARDILVNGMFEAEKAGYPVIGTVHDELLTEQEVDAGSVHELEKVVCRLPEWAEGLPIGAEGFESVRYRKG